MSTRTGPGPGGVMAERGRLIGLAYRLLGSLAEAEDAVQEAYARWYALTPDQQDAIGSPAAWLTTVASRICLDLLGSARARRERYVGQWIPEPLPGPAAWASTRPAADPADRVTLDESVSMAFLVVLESMTPAQRVTFILHDVFAYPFTDVAQIVGRTPAACRQLATSARRRDSHGPPGPHRQGLQAGLGSQGHQRPHRPAGPRRHRDRRRRRPGQRRAAADRRRRADRALHGRSRQPGSGQPDVHRTHGQRPARPGRSARRRHRRRVRVRHRWRPDQAHLGHTQPRQAPALDGKLGQRADEPP